MNLNISENRSDIANAYSSCCLKSNVCFWQVLYMYILFIPRPNNVLRGYRGIALSVCLSARLFFSKTSCPGIHVTSDFLVRSGYYLTKFLSMSQECVMTLTKGNAVKVNNTMHTYPKYV